MDSKDHDKLAEALANEMAPKESPVQMPGRGNWYPDLNPTQRLIFEDPAEIIIGSGPKGSGKSLGFGHKIIRHAYEEENAMVTMVSPTQSTGYEGIGFDIENLILPQWHDGMGLEYKRFRMDPVSKDRHLWIGNRKWGWSKIVLKSIPHASMVESRIKGPAPSMFYADELDVAGGRDYFTFPHAQLGRRRGIIGPQQYLASCNPSGPDHWLYKLIYEEYVVQTGGRVWPDDKEIPGIRRDSAMSVYFVPFAENKHRLPPGYQERLEKLFRSDPVLYERLINGRWIEYPSGEAIFKSFFSETKHFVGDAKTNRGLIPHTGIPIVVGYDLGKVNSAIIFAQCIETVYGPMWLVLDELCYVGEKIPYKRLSRVLLSKMAYWNRRMEYKFTYRHISDNSAFNQFQAARGSTDAMDILEYTTEAIANNKEAFAGLEPVRLVECPKPPNSIKDRVSILMDLLHDSQIVVSATCTSLRKMFLNLERSKEDPVEPMNPSRHKHPFDALSYMLYYRHNVAKRGFHEADGKAVEIVT